MTADMTVNVDLADRRRRRLGDGPAYKPGLSRSWRTTFCLCDSNGSAAGTGSGIETMRCVALALGVVSLPRVDRGTKLRGAAAVPSWIC